MSKLDNRAAYMTGLNKIEIRQIPMPEAKEKEVVIKLEYVGICGSDVHYLEKGRIGGFIVEGDFILGHECAGEVVEIGANVKNIAVGDKVALEPGIPCGECALCKAGKYNLCPDVEFLATPPYHGSLMNYIAYPENMVFKLPKNVSTKEGALIEPLAVGLHAANQGQVSLGESVLIFGAGCIGLVTLLACKARGAGKVIVADVLDKRLEYAKKLGADIVINSAKENIADIINEATNGAGCDKIMETAGNKNALQQTPYFVKRGGDIVLVGLCQEDKIEYDFSQIMAKEITVHSVFRYRNIYQSAIEAIDSGKIDVKGIVSHEFEFDDTEKAFFDVIANKSEVVKAVIKL